MAQNRSDTARAIGERLKLVRLAYAAVQGRVISQSEMARLTGVGIAAWNNAETGDNRLGLDNAMKVSRTTGVSLDYIYFGERAGLPHALAVELEKLENPKAGKRA